MFSFLRKTSLYILAIPVLLFGLGAASNQVVLQANHNRFPVLVNETKVREFNSEKVELGPMSITVVKPANVDSDGVVMIDDTHCVMTSETHLNFLADVFDLGNIYSIGDFLLMLGEWLMGFAPFIFLFDVTRKLRVA
jgi:hypothetical protein